MYVYTVPSLRNFLCSAGARFPSLALLEHTEKKNLKET